MESATMTDKDKKKARDHLKILHNQIKGAFSFGQIKDWTTLYSKLGIVKVDARPLSFADLKEFLEKQKQELEDKLNGQSNIQTNVRQDTPITSNPIEDSAAINSGCRESVTQIQYGGIKTYDTSNSRRRSGTVNDIQSTQSLSTSLLPTVQSGKELPVKEEPKPSDYGWIPSPNAPQYSPFWHQKKAGAELKKKIFEEGKTGLLLLAPTGSGKTFIAADVIRHALDIKYQEGRTWSHIPFLYITKATILQQTGRVFNVHFNMRPNVDVEVINIEQLRSGPGQYWVKQELKVVDGEEVETYTWKPFINPCIMLVDESQGTKNKGSKQSKIVYRYNDLPLLSPAKKQTRCLVSISATPFVRVSEAQGFAVSTGRPLDHIPGFPKGAVLTNETWPLYAAHISHPSKPSDYNQAAVARLVKDLEPWIVRVKGVRPQFDAVNGVKVIEFDTLEQKKFYHNAWERFLEEKAKLDRAKLMGETVGTCYLVVLLKFAMAAELCHADHFARDMDRCVRNGKAAVAAVKFKQTLIKIVQLLIEKYGWKRSDISLIWGGGQTKLTKKQTAKAKIRQMEDKLKALGISADEMISNAGLDDVEDRVLIEYPPAYRLEGQDDEERQKEIDNFQSGKTLFALYTLKAGGVGLSLHHSDELTSFKCRRKESGYVFEEDIPKVPVRPRETFVVVTYNAIELVQGVGRVPRLTSLSPTIQNVYCYAGTVETDMAHIYSKKLRCLSEVVKQKEDWQNVILGGNNRSYEIEKVIEATKDAEDNDSSLIDEGDSEDDENGKE